MISDRDVRERTLVLADTCLEGLTHMKWQMKEGYYESSLSLYCDVLDAIMHIERSLEHSFDTEDDNASDGWFAVQEQLSGCLNELADAYRARLYHELPKRLARLVPAYRLWHHAVHVRFSPNYLV